MLPGLMAGAGIFGGGGILTLFAAWELATVTAVNLSGSNLIATNTGTTSADQGAHVASGSSRNASSNAKLYVEFQFTTFLGGGNVGIGFADISSSSYSALGNNATLGVMIYAGSGNIWINGSNTGVSLGARSSGDWIGGALDLLNSKVWLKKVSGTPGNWNNNGSADPATNTGGLTIPASRTQWAPYGIMGGTSGVANNVITLNAGASALSAPSGFTAGWTA